MTDLELRIKGLHGDIDKNQDEAKKLHLEWEFAQRGHTKNRGLGAGLDEAKKLNDDLIKKLRRLRGDIDSQVDLNRAMQDNPDYDYEQPEIKRFGDKLQDFTNRANRDDAARKKIDGDLAPIRDRALKGKVTGPDLETYNTKVDLAVKELRELHADVDAMQGSLDKKRRKQADHKIADHIAVRPKEATDCQGVMDRAKDKLAKLKAEGQKPERPGGSPNRQKEVLAKRARENEKLLNQL